MQLLEPYAVHVVFTQTHTQSLTRLFQPFQSTNTQIPLKGMRSVSGVRAVRIHRSLPQASQSLHASSVSICRDVAYSNKQRTVMDIYIPSHHAASPQSSNCNDSQPNAKELGPTEHPVNSVVDAQAGSVQRQLPVALFCHGGVWATGQPICLFFPLCLAGQATSMLAIYAIVL